MNIIKEQYPYRYCESNSKDQGWIEKYNEVTSKYFKMYECDSPLQLLTAIDDFDYTLWLDPHSDTRDRVRRPNIVRGHNYQRYDYHITPT